ncbi:unnamed protein product [Orchesella dallaii]|uniref:Sodium/potassium-transporting ATPase subunit alpha n=1 Tax=Orchesella dallaii TaxID=48710 RepID=A0ABP1PNI7_9HEXA
MERSGLPFVTGIVHEHITMDSFEDEEQGQGGSDEWLDVDDDPSKPFLRPVRIYGSRLARDKDVIAFEERAEEREWDIDDHKIEVLELQSRYDTDLHWGLSEKQVLKNRKHYGENFLQPPPKPSAFLKFFRAVIGGLNALLWGSAFLSFLSYGAQYIYTDRISNDNLVLGCALIVVVHISGAFSFYQEFKSSRIMESFKTMVPRSCVVFREGSRAEIDVKELVVGDLVEINYGDLVPADIRILECQNFTVDNSALTGEAEPQKRLSVCTDDNPMETKNLAFFSTNAVQGTAKGVVIRVGNKTLMGRLAKLACGLDSGPSPIAVEMNKFIMIMTIRSLVFGGVFFGLALAIGFSLIDSIFFLIGIVVANVPEGLAVTFTTILSVTAKRMAKNHCLVKHLHAVEALGSTSCICSDKTGTLTQNVMSVAHLFFNSAVALADTSEFVTGQQFDMQDPGFAALANVAALCSRANFRPGQEDIPVLKRTVEGDASETAILKFMELQMGNVSRYRVNFPKLCEIPFNSTNKYQVSIHDMSKTSDPRHLLVIKGAPERVINLCTTILNGNEELLIDARQKEIFNSTYVGLAKLGERVLGFADCRLPLDRFPLGYKFSSEDPDYLDIGFRFVGLISMIDPPRASVPDAVSKCRSAGIRLVMVTGDHPVTAKAIARAVNILSEGNETIEERAERLGCTVEEINPTTIKAAVVSGAELKLLSASQLRNLLRNHTEIVFARTSPEQKYIIVDAFQKLGYIVAATGDGVNDSPALKKADVGVSMGIAGTEVSKETADIILMDDNFSSIVTGIEEGRLIFDNLKKLIAYNMADNIAEMYSVWLFMVLRIPLPMGTIAMLLTVLGTDVLPAISIAYEKAEADIMKLRPRNPKKQTLVTPQLLSYTYGQTAVLECTAGFFAYFLTYAQSGWLPGDLIGIEKKWHSRSVNDLVDSYGQEWSYEARSQLGLTSQTAFFVAIVLTQFANVICCKTRRVSLFQKGMRNKKMNAALIFALALVGALVYVPNLNASVNLTVLRPEVWLAPLPFAFFLIIYDEIRKFIVRNFPKTVVGNHLDT